MSVLLALTKNIAAEPEFVALQSCRHPIAELAKAMLGTV